MGPVLVVIWLVIILPTIIFACGYSAAVVLERRARRLSADRGAALGAVPESSAQTAG